MEQYPKPTGEKEDGLDVVDWTSFQNDILPQLTRAANGESEHAPSNTTISINDRIALGDAWIRMEDRVKKNGEYPMRDFSMMSGTALQSMMRVKQELQFQKEGLDAQRELMDLARGVLGEYDVGIHA